MKQLLTRVAPILAAAVLTACNTAGPRALQNGRVLYNEVVNVTNNEQLLLNLVRLRYRDTPLFLEVTSLSTQYSLSASAGLSGGVASGEEDYGGSVGLEYAEKPTISFAPLQGDKFVTELLSPISPSTVALLLHSTWRADRVLRCVVQGMNGVPNAPSASSPSPTDEPQYREFKSMAEQLRALQKRNQLEIGASEDGRLVLRVTPEAAVSPEMKGIAEALGLAPGRTQYDMIPSVLGRSQEQIGVNMRSLIGVMFFLSHGVDVPPEHEERGLVTVTRTADGGRFDWGDVSGDLLHIRSSRERPADATVRVRYRGAWFFIADDDLNSKSTFSMLSQLFALQAGGVPAAAPVLTLPIG